jgi:hypothetical protein
LLLRRRPRRKRHQGQRDEGVFQNHNTSLTRHGPSVTLIAPPRKQRRSRSGESTRPPSVER